MHTSTSLYRRTIPFFASLILLVMFGLTGIQASAARVSGQLSDNVFTSADLGVATTLVTDSTLVYTPDGLLAGSSGVLIYVDSLKAEYPDARFTITGSHTVGDLIIFDWQGTVDGEMVFPGRTLVNTDNGAISEVWILNLNNVSPPVVAPLQEATGPNSGTVSGEPSSTNLFSIAPDLGNELGGLDVFERAAGEFEVVHAVTAAALEAQSWPNYDPSGLASVNDAIIEAQRWPNYDPSSLGPDE